MSAVVKLQQKPDDGCSASFAYRSFNEQIERAHALISGALSRLRCTNGDLDTATIRLLDMAHDEISVLTHGQRLAVLAGVTEEEISAISYPDA